MLVLGSLYAHRSMEQFHIMLVILIDPQELFSTLCGLYSSLSQDFHSGSSLLLMGTAHLATSLLRQGLHWALLRTKGISLILASAASLPPVQALNSDLLTLQ